MSIITYFNSEQKKIKDFYINFFAIAKIGRMSFLLQTEITVSLTSFILFHLRKNLFHDSLISSITVCKK